MPELPEVETIRRILEPQIMGRSILSITVYRPEIIEHPSAEQFAGFVTGANIRGMSRRGKFLSLRLDSGDTVWLHMRMTGQLLVTPPDYPTQKHTHIVFRLDNAMELRFIDTRRFGRFWLLHEWENDTFTGIAELGLEPFDGCLTADWLREKIGKRRKSIKECLLDQSVVAGIGNIYGDEILFAAQLCPCRPACSLKGEEWGMLASAIPSVLKKGIDDNRMTPKEYLAGQGKEYRSEKYFMIYGHNGQPCPCCNTPLTRIVLSGRSSVYCPSCQKALPC